MIGLVAETRALEWAIASAVLGAAAGVTQIVKTVVAWPTTSGSGLVLLACVGVVGFVAIAGGIVALRKPKFGGLVLVGAGVLALALDAFGPGTPPRILPALVMWLAAACALGAVPTAPATSPWGKVAVALGIAVHVALALPLAAFGLVVPIWALVVILAVWGSLLVLALRVRRRRPWLVLAAPVLALGFALGTAALGGALLGWTA